MSSNNLLRAHKTRIVCTIGPASQAPATLERMVRAGLDVARLNLAHGDFDSHRATMATVRQVAARAGRRVALLADLPGPKLRVGPLWAEVVELKRGQTVRLLALGASPATSAPNAGKAPDGHAAPPAAAEEIRREIPLTLASLPGSLKAGDDVFLNDGLIQLRIQGEVCARDAAARVVVGGELRARDGMSLPGLDLGISAFTARDRELLAFALEEGIDAVAVSFVQGPDDIRAVRAAAEALGFDPFVIAKVERSQAVERIDAVLELADGLMVARGDLGVEIPIERVGVTQKLLIAKANAAGRPVITATQMLESMTENRRPTRAEVSDVTNAVLDGTDCVMLSEETAMGQFPVDAVTVMAGVIGATERSPIETRRPPADGGSVRAIVAEQAAATAERLKARYIMVPTESGTTARAIARLRPRAWVVAFSPFAGTCQRLQFSRGVYPVYVPEAAHQPLVAPRVAAAKGAGPAEPGAGGGEPDVAALPTCAEVDWHGIARRWVRAEKLEPGLAVMIQGNNRLEVLDLAAEV